ncbi:Arylsulfotransferase (ASST) [Teratosphaeria destructans]|uniref:Arylsulfotransferase (ASST) n=1 Tax=Teratosphaeria destructans TaxID=418781 RepID=A0A9W7SLS2_9PEZI|nr:Arylsulfotransferase (ASST) [Teratosphaeria destructans]
MKLLATTLASIIQLSAADWQFKSRTDLAPPRLNITVPAAPNVEKGYLFVAPFAGYPDTATEQHGPRQAGPYIFRDNGDLVWSGYGIYSIWSTNFQAAKWKGQDVLFSFEGDHNAGYGHGHGHTTIMDQHYETIREIRAGNHKLTDKHEFHVVSDNTAVIQIYQPVPRDLTEWDASEEQQWIVNAIFQEVDMTTGEMLFEWAKAVLPINPGQAGSGYNSSDAWDYFHINSVDKNAEGDYLISARDACSVHKISGIDGSILWRLDGKNSSFTLGENVTFCFQHHARFHPELKNTAEGDNIEIISLYDNSAHGTEDGRGTEVATAPTSSGKIIKLDTEAWTAELVQGFYPPDGLRSKSQGSTQLLPNGNVIVNWGSQGALTEYDSNGKVLFHTYMDSEYLGLGVENYRGFRYNWTGLPNEEPAIIALENGESTTIYVSWNGDTETQTWRFFAVTGKYGARRWLGEAPRASFETSLKVESKHVLHVLAEALDANGKVLRSTGLVKTEPEILPAKKVKSFPPLVVQGEQKQSWRDLK